MTLERMVSILGQVKNKPYVLRRQILTPTSITSAIKTYVLEIWDVKELVKIVGVRCNGVFTAENNQELREQAEREFMEKLFENMEEKYVIQ